MNLCTENSESRWQSKRFEYQMNKNKKVGFQISFLQISISWLHH